MKTIGLVGGMSWVSTAEYYRIINEEARRRRGGHNSARILMASVDFADVRRLQQREAWDEAAGLLAAHARRLEQAGADVVVLCTNLMHKTAPQIEAALRVPFLHIADAVGAVASENGLRTLGVLGARQVMEEPFYRERLGDRFGIDVIVPPEPDRALVDRVIFDELTQSVFTPASRVEYARIVQWLADEGADGVVLACTEISLLLQPEDVTLPLIDSMQAHAMAAVDFAQGAQRSACG